MGRRRRLLLCGAFGAKRPRLEPGPGAAEAGGGAGGAGGVSPLPGSPGSVEAALRDVAALFPRGLFGDALPPLVLRHQLYSLVSDRTAVDRHLNRLRDEGRIRLLHLGLGSDALGVVFTEPYREKVLAAVAGTPRAGLVRRFLDAAVAACPDLGYEQGRLRALGFQDGDVTQLVAAGVLTVRDAGSWWLAVPGVGRFVRAFVRASPPPRGRCCDWLSPDRMFPSMQRGLVDQKGAWPRLATPFRRTGATWSPTRVAADDGSAGDGLSLGALAVAGDEVLLLFARCAHPPQACGPPSTHLLRSRDGGRSWGPPQNLSGVVGNEVFAPGPGYGIQKQRAPARGRLVFCGHGTLERDGVSLLLSDDGGRPRDFTPDECQPYELPDGSIAVNIRNQNFYRCRCRMVARSWDGGETLPPGAVTFDSALVDPAVAAGVLVTGDLVFFSNPAHESQRVNLTLRWSFTNGTTWWGRGLQVWAGPSGYSSMAAPPPGARGHAPFLYLIYEKGRSLSTETVSLATISIAGDP